MWTRKRTGRATTSADTSDRTEERGDHEETAIVIGVMLAFVLVAFGGFFEAITSYKTYFGTPETLAAKAVAEAASNAASGVPSTALADARAAWGQYGDYLGGRLNPILSFLSFAALALALLLQARQVGLSRIELRETRKERADAMKDAQAQLKATRTLAAAQIRTARAQERASQLLGRQLEEASAAARAQERTAQALLLQARVTTLSTQLAQANAMVTVRLEEWKEAQSRMTINREKHGAGLATAEIAYHAAVAEVTRLQAAVEALQPEA